MEPVQSENSKLLVQELRMPKWHQQSVILNAGPCAQVIYYDVHPVQFPIVLRDSLPVAPLCLAASG